MEVIDTLKKALGQLFSTAGRMHTFHLPRLGAAKQVVSTGATNNVQLTTGTQAISIMAKDGPMSFKLGTSGSVTAATTDHAIGQNERLEIALEPDGTQTYIAAISDSGTATLRITELAL